MSNPLYTTKNLFFNKANQFFVTISPVKGALPVDDYKINAALVNVEVPDVANENFEEYIAGKFYTAYGRNSIYQINMTFKDIYPSVLYQYFNDYLVINRKQYTDECKWEIKVDTTYPGGERTEILDVKDGLLIGVSGLTFDHSVDQILEFSCTWKFTLFNEEGALRTNG
jgi:hypothetical protein